MGDADEADMLSSRIPARLRFRPHPPPLPVGAAIASFQHERFQARLAGDALPARCARQSSGMQDRPPVERQRLFVGNTEKFQIGLVCERPGAVDLGHPHRHRRAVGDQPEPLFALAQCFLRNGEIGDVDVRADQPQRLAPSGPRSIRATVAIQRTCPSLGRMMRY